MDKFKRKNVTFKVDDPDEMKLYNELQKVAHGDFSRITKELWIQRLKPKLKPISRQDMKESIIAMLEDEGR